MTSWLLLAMALPGRACAVAVHIWHLAGMKKSPTVRLRLSLFPFQRDAARRGLAELEAAGLVSVVRHVGRAPIVTLQDVRPPPEGGGGARGARA